MFGNRTILYWFSYPLRNTVCPYFDITFAECSRLVPVFCFDPREEQFFSNSSAFYRYWNETVERVETLRSGLQSKGSNLLIVNGSYEVLIPSLSRVLNADEVVANTEISSTDLISSNLVDFRKKKTLEIQYNLKMHSITMKLENIGASQFNEYSDKFYLPPFPEINPGNVPVKPLQEFKHH